MSRMDNNECTYCDRVAARGGDGLCKPCMKAWQAGHRTGERAGAVDERRRVTTERHDIINDGKAPWCPGCGVANCWGFCEECLATLPKDTPIPKRARNAKADVDTDRQRDIENEGQRAAIYYAEKEAQACEAAVEELGRGAWTNDPAMKAKHPPELLKRIRECSKCHGTACYVCDPTGATR